MNGFNIINKYFVFYLRHSLLKAFERFPAELTAIMAGRRGISFRTLYPCSKLTGRIEPSPFVLLKRCSLRFKTSETDRYCALSLLFRDKDPEAERVELVICPDGIKGGISDASDFVEDIAAILSLVLK